MRTKVILLIRIAQIKLFALTCVCSAASGVQCDQDAFDTILKVSQGDMRKAITYLQSASRYNNKVVEGVHILGEYLLVTTLTLVDVPGATDISGRVSDSLMDRFQEIMKSDIYADLEVRSSFLILSRFRFFNEHA